MFFKKSKTGKIEPYDHENLYPAIRSSICTGEKVAGFKNKGTGSFTEIMLISSDKDLEAFKRKYGITSDIEMLY